MPVYEYKCHTCGKEFEYTQRITEDSLKTCPEDICEEPVKCLGEVERKISKNVGLVFKGSGFYLTDYVHKHNKATSSPVPSPTTKVESKPEPPKSPSTDAA